MDLADAYYSIGSSTWMALGAINYLCRVQSDGRAPSREVCIQLALAEDANVAAVLLLARGERPLPGTHMTDEVRAALAIAEVADADAAG